MKVLVLIAFFVMIGAFWAGAVSAMSPSQYTPMTPDEERAWLKDVSNLTDEEIEEIINL